MQNSPPQKELQKPYSLREDFVLSRIISSMLVLSAVISLFFWILVILTLGNRNNFNGLLSFALFLLPAEIGSIITIALLIFHRIELSTIHR